MDRFFKWGTDVSSCAWCRLELPTTRAGARYCSRRCRQAAFRLRRRRATGFRSSEGPLRFAYADPPYPGLSRKYYGDEPSYAGEVDHAALIASLAGGGYAGWALSTSAAALRDILSLCPAGARVCPWVKPIAPSPQTYGIHNRWEAVIVVGGRLLRPGVRDWLRAQPARGGGTLMGRKPIAFCAWLFDLLGMLPGDELDDVFPGTGIVARAWSELSSRSSATTSPVDGRRSLFAIELDDASLACRDDETSPGAPTETSPADPADTEKGGVLGYATSPADAPGGLLGDRNSLAGAGRPEIRRSSRNDAIR